MKTPRQPSFNRGLGTVWGASVAERRRTLSLSQTDLAALCCVTQQAISRIEKGLSIPSDNLKVVLCRNLGTDPTQLFPWPAMKDLVAA